ncbi:hypothetical protein ACA910_014451 [Epithemia clementina (nom. ined.)]
MIQEIPLEDVRNFCFIAHIDHGKSSLSSRILELTGNFGRETQQLAWEAALLQEGISLDDDGKPRDSIKPSSSKASSKERIDALDTLAVEQQRGITVKASTASMLYRHPSAIGPHKTLLVNMYDTPGHVDFGREVTRSLNFVQGAVLLLDSTQGIQAQTWSVYEKVKALAPNDPKLLIALTKIDLEAARPIHCAVAVSEWLQDWDGDPDSIVQTSARSRIGIRPLLEQVCEQVPPPQRLADDDDDDTSILLEPKTKQQQQQRRGTLRAQVMDSWFDSRGVNCLVRVVSGQLTEGDRVTLVVVASDSSQQQQQQQNQSSYPVQEVGLVVPHELRTKILGRGQMGYVRFGLRDPRQALPGTLLLHSDRVQTALSSKFILPQLPPEATVAKSVLYASVHPQEADGFEDLCSAVDRLALNDTGLEVQRTSSASQNEAVGGGSSKSSGGGGGPSLGPGLRVGFQGLLHVEVFRQRLSDEFQIDAVVTPPKVPYRATYLPSKFNNLTEPVTKIVEDLKDWPPSTISTSSYIIEEPMVKVRIVARVADAGPLMELITRKRGTQISTQPIDEEKWFLHCVMPWAEVVVDFHDQLKTLTQGFGSMDTFEAGYAESKLQKVEIVLNGDLVEPLSFVSHKDAAQAEGRIVCQKLKDVLPRQQFVIIIQARVGSKIIASERIQAYRKDVLTKSGKTVGGGDVTRKMKLLQKQKEGKKRMQATGKVQLTQAAFNSVISRS